MFQRVNLPSPMVGAAPGAHPSKVTEQAESRASILMPPGCDGISRRKSLGALGQTWFSCVPRDKPLHISSLCVHICKVGRIRVPT